MKQWIIIIMLSIYFGGCADITPINSGQAVHIEYTSKTRGCTINLTNQNGQKRERKKILLDFNDCLEIEEKL